ncbi:MAG: HTH domain-containing protein [Chloroflexaceae bacterium]|nr:HTH domain-containing protein [Chloroflexaceae bacterium]
MELPGFRNASPASIILQYLQRHGEVTIKQLEDVLEVSTTAVREHLANLQLYGLIATRTMRSGPGRPRLVYTLTDKAHDLFPKQYDVLINLLLQEIAAGEGPNKVEQLLERVSRRIAHEYAGNIQEEGIAGRLAQLRTLLEQRGVPSEVEAEGIGIHIFSCPYLDVAQEHEHVCTMDRQMVEQVLGQKVTLKQSIRQGHHQCSFIVDTPDSAA